MIEAKVDIRKLQLLNDRIAQAIDALNQVRLSVHGAGQQLSPYGYGLGHAVNPQLQPFGAPQPTPVQQQYAQPYPQFGAVSPMQPWGGLQHATQGTWPQTGLEQIELARACDPNRIAQTFPYCLSPVTPFVY